MMATWGQFFSPAVHAPTIESGGKPAAAVEGESASGRGAVAAVAAAALESKKGR